MRYDPVRSVALASFAFAVPSALASAQTTYYVDDDTCPGVGAGTRQDPFCSIQHAIDASASGDTILVAPGDYAEAIRYNGTNVVVRSLEGPSMTRIRGDLTTLSVVTFQDGEGSGALIEGFSIGPDLPAPGSATGQRGILCRGSSPTIRGNVIEHNWISDVGAGINCDSGAAPFIVGNHIRRNVSIPGVGFGGGIACGGASPWIYANIIEGNSAFSDPGGRGGGVVLGLSDAVLEGNLIIGNGVCDQGFGDGGALWIQGPGSPSLIGNTIVSNLACTRGGALFVSSGNVTIRDTILWGNTSPDGSEIFTAPFGSTTLSYCNVSGGASAYGGTGPVNSGPGMMSAAPMFVADGDYHLQAGSPVIDAGWPGRDPGGTDGDLEPRLLDGDLDGLERVDMGWDEYDWTGLSVTGTPAIGQVITLHTTAPAGWTYILAFARARGDQPLPPFGSVLLASGKIRMLAAGSVPGADELFIPPVAEIVGVEFFLQSLGQAPGGTIGNLSRRLELRVE